MSSTILLPRDQHSVVLLLPRDQHSVVLGTAVFKQHLDPFDQVSALELINGVLQRSSQQFANKPERERFLF